MAQAVARWKDSTDKSGLYSNFGELWHRVNARIAQVHGRHTYVCSSGTDAVRLAIYAAVKHWGERVDGIYVEPFTFEGTLRAAEELSRLLFGRPLLSLPSKRALVVATVPYGRWRHFSLYTDRPVVVDAAGAYRHVVGAFHYFPAHAPIAVSFHATKNYPIGEGGAAMLPPRWRDECEHVREAMNFGFSRSGGKHGDFGTNAKIDELRCSLLLGQIDRWRFFTERSQRIADLSYVYQGMLGGSIQYVTGHGQSLAVVSSPSPVALVSYLAERGIAAKRVYVPHRQIGMLSTKERQLVALPSDVNNEELTHISKALRRFKGKRK